MTELPVRDGVLLDYMTMAPLPLAFERSLEASIYTGERFERPVLDIGCGEGLFARIVFADRVDTGIDPNPRELERAAELAGYQELIRCSGDAIPKPDAAFRTIFSNSVLEHIPDLEPVLREVRRLLAPGGRFYCTVPTDNFERYSVGNELLSALGLVAAARGFRARFNSHWRHYHCYPLAGWEDLLGRSGLHVVESFTFDPRRVCLLNDLLVPLAAPGYLLKRLTNRWTLVPPLRRVLLFPAYLAARRYLRGGERAEPGGLAFLCATKDGAE